MINLILLLSLVSSVSSQRLGSQLCYPFVQQDCPLGQRCEQGICQRDMCYTDLDCPIYPSERCENGRCVPETLECGGSCMYFPGSICENGQCVWPPSALCYGRDYLPCSSGYVCTNGFCERDRECTSDSDCPDSHRAECVNGKCQLFTSMS
ncbi:tenascin-like [Saccostrea cucullata]|uniref:tenascin-like n=1 Tax=Saccostrea cuccullata TaxID=36930 RepID=UPI002ED22EBC